ncbi:MAG: hypothetical protein L0219_16765 [Phycisphaerales bacterium]|nr:hypothetical protein [Phycisphaerales bacterium]
MIARSNPFDAVRSLLNGRDVSEGFTVLWEKGRLDLSVEAIVLKPEWRGYFSAAELDTARRRLSDVKYRVPWDNDEANVPANGTEIESLLAELSAAGGDVVASKRIRARLRSLGYYGGLRQRESDMERGISRSTAASSAEIVETPTILPPVADAEVFVERIRSLVGLPERNHEDVVKDLLLRLGFDASSIVFQQGRIDVRVLTQDRKTAAVFEVKRTIVSESERAAARRQGMDYASQTGALIIVVTDGDRYEIYDRRRGHDYSAMLCGKFQLPAFRDSDATTLDLLRPDCLRSVCS